MRRITTYNDVSMNVSYRKRGDSWQIRFRGTGKKETTKTYPGTLQERTIQRKADWFKEEYALGRFDPWEEVSPLLVEEALFRCLEDNLQSGIWAKNSTYKTNKSVLARMLGPVYGSKIALVNSWQSLFNDFPGNAYTKRSDRARLNSFLSYCYKKEWISKQYKVQLEMKDVVEIRNSSAVKYITIGQLENICDAHKWVYQQNHLIFNTQGRKAPDFYPDIWMFYFYSLLRKEELPKLKVKDLNGNRLAVKGKGRRTDIITLPPPALRIARAFLRGKGPDDHLFVSDTNRATKHLARAIDLAIGTDHYSKGFHQLRHSGIVHYISEGIPVQFVSKLARHKSIQITLDIYADVLPDKMEEAFSQIKP